MEDALKFFAEKYGDQMATGFDALVSYNLTLAIITASACSVLAVVLVVAVWKMVAFLRSNEAGEGEELACIIATTFSVIGIIGLVIGVVDALACILNPLGYTIKGIL